MNIYRIYQETNNEYDTYDSAIVVAENKDQAKKMSPSYYDEVFYDFNDTTYSNWSYKLEDVKVELIGKADKKYKEPTLILSSFNAG